MADTKATDAKSSTATDSDATDADAAGQSTNELNTEKKSGIVHFDGTVSKISAEGVVVASSYVDYDNGEKLTTEVSDEEKQDALAQSSGDMEGTGAESTPVASPTSSTTSDTGSTSGSTSGAVSSTSPTSSTSSTSPDSK